MEGEISDLKWVALVCGIKHPRQEREDMGEMLCKMLGFSSSAIKREIL